MLGALSFFKESIYAQEYALQRGFLQTRNPFVKTATILLFILLALFVKHISFLLWLYVICLALVYLSRISLIFFLVRTWIFVPLFSLFIAIPALFSIFTPGKPLYSFRLFGLELIVTQPGLFSARLFVMRVVTSVSFSVLLALTTKHNQLLKVLRIFRVPSVFVMTLGMCYRYLYFFVAMIENTYLAIKSRVGSRIHYKKGQKIVAGSMANLWQRSYQLHNQVYNAMLSRGYKGELYILDEFHIDYKDLLWLGGVIVFFLSVLYLNYTLRAQG